ncbi:MAG: hypothetical protein WCK33_13655, partial [Phycisphaerae bacterium]
MQLFWNPLSLAAAILFASTAPAAVPLQVQVRAVGGAPAPRDTATATIPGRGWFPYFRFYGPLEAYFDKSWQL